MLKVWRNKLGAVFAECSVCGSYGTAGHLQPVRKLDPEIADALERHTAHMMALRSHYNTAVTAIMAKVRSKAMQRADAVEQVRQLWGNHVAQVRMGEQALPDPTGKVKDVVVACPWCEAIAPEQEIEQLPDGVIEPPFELAKVVLEHINKQMAEDAAKQGGK